MATHCRSQCLQIESLVERGCIVVNCVSLIGRLAGLVALGRGEHRGTGRDLRALEGLAQLKNVCLRCFRLQSIYVKSWTTIVSRGLRQWVGVLTAGCNFISRAVGGD